MNPNAFTCRNASWWLMRKISLALQGTGKKKMEEELTLLEVKYPNNARGIAKFNVPLAHMMFAGADFIIVPSRFEPCGLIQLQGMRYGVVRISNLPCYISSLISFEGIS